MSQAFLIRELQGGDLPPLRIILDRTGLFPPEMLSAMADPYLSGQAPHLSLVAIKQQRPIGFAYIEPERMTVGTFNLLAMAVEPKEQGSGVGNAIVADLMDRLRRQGGRVLLVETSSLDEFAPTRAFYAGQNFSQEARIRDFYADGEDKLIYWKRM